MTTELRFVEAKGSRSAWRIRVALKQGRRRLAVVGMNGYTSKWSWRYPEPKCPARPSKDFATSQEACADCLAFFTEKLKESKE